MLYKREIWECIIRQENNFTQMGSIIIAIRLIQTVVYDLLQLLHTLPPCSTQFIPVQGRRHRAFFLYSLKPCYLTGWPQCAQP